MKRAFAGFLFLGAGLGVLAGRAAAVDRYWDGIDQFGVPAVNNRWTTAANWRQLGVNDDVIPAAGDNVFLDHTFVGAAYTVDQRQNVGGGNSLLNTLTINPRPGAFAGGTISILCTRSLFTGTLILQPDAGFNIEIRNSNGAARQLRVDTAIQIATTYVATGGTVNIGTFSAANDFEYDFDQILTPSGATFEIGPNVTVNMRLFNNSVANSDDEVRLAWLKVDNGATLTIDCKDNKPVATPYHYFRLLAGDAAFPGRALVVGAGATITLTNVGDDIVVLQDLAADSTCTFGDPDAVSETATVGGTGYFAIFRRTTFQRAFGAPAGTDNLTVSTTLWLQQSAAVDALTIEDSLDVNFSGTKFQHQFGSLTCGTTAANDGTVTIAGTTVGLAVQELPYDQTTVDVTHTVTVNGAGNLTYLAPINIYGNGVASGGQGRIVLNDSAVLNLGDAPADTTTLVGADDLAPDNWGGEIALNGSSTLNVSGDLVVDRRTTAGGQLTVNASAVANVTGAMNVNLAAAAGEDGGKVDVNGTGRVWVGGALTIQGQSAAAGSPARVTVNSTRAVSEGLAVTGTTTVQGGSTTNSRGELIVNTGATVLLTGAVAVNSGTGFGGQLTVNGTGVVNTGGALNVNLTAAAGEDGGKVDVNGTGRLSVGGALTIQGQTAAADTPARVTVNSTRGDPTVPPEGLAVTGTTTIQGGSTTNSRGELIVNTGALVLLTGAVAVNSGTGFGGQLTVNGTAVVNTGGALNVNLTAAASEDGGKVDVNGTGRLLVGGALLIQGQAVAADTPARLTIASTRGDPTVPPEGLVVTGITTIQGAPVGGNANSRGELIVSTDGLIQFTGGVTIASGSAQPGLLDVTDATAPGPTIRFAGDLTVNGLLRPRGSGGANFSTFQANGAGDQLYSGSTATLPLFYNLDITGGSGTKTLDLTPPMEVQNTFTVGAGATCRIPSGQDFRLARDKGAFPPDQHTVNGVFEIETGNSVDGTTKIKFGNRQQLLVTGAGSALTIVAGPEGMSFASNRDVLFTGDNATDAWSVHLADGASVSMEFVKIRRISGRTDESDLNAAEATEATVQTGLAISTARANITRFRAIDFDECLDGDDGAAPFARFPRYLYFISDADDLGWDGMGQLGILDALRFQNSGGLPGQSNIEKRTPAGAPVTNIYPRNAKDDIPPTGAAEDDDMDGDRGVPEDTGREDIIFYTNPTAVTLADLVATGYDSAVVVEWRTGQELDNLGFNLYRSPYPDRGWVQMNPSLILGLGDSQAGGRYALADRAVENGVRYFYLLEDVDVRGVRTLHGPVSAVPVAGLVMPELDPAEFVSLGNGDRGARADPAPGSARGPPGTSGDRRSRVTDVEALLGTDLMRAGIWLIEYDETGAVLLVVPPAPTLTPEVWDGELRTRIEMAGYGSTRVPGLPAVPEKRVLLVTPGIESASVRILEADSRRLAGLSPTRNAERGARNGGQGAGWDRNRPADPADIVRFLARARQEIMENRRRAREEIVRARAEAREILTRRSSMGHGPGAGAGAGGRGPGAGAEGRERTRDLELFPGSLVALGPLLWQGGRQLLPLDIHPVQAATDRADVYRRILVRIDFHGEWRDDPGGPQEPETIVDTPDQRRLAADPGAIKIKVREDGLYRLTRGELASAGFNFAADPRGYRIYNLGREIAIRVTGEIDGVFDEGDEILFYGRKNPWRTADNAEATRHTDENVYWLEAGTGRGVRMEEDWVRPLGAAPAVDHAATLHLEDNSTYYPRLARGEGRDHWFFSGFLYNTPGGDRASSRASYRPMTPWLSPLPHTARIEVAVAGVTELPADPDHRVLVALNGEPVGEVLWDGRIAAKGTFELPPGLLIAGENVVELRVPADLPGVSQDYVLVNFVRLSYRRRFVADRESLTFTRDGSGEFEAAGFSPGEVFGLDISAPSRPRFLRGMAADGGTIRWNDSALAGGGSYFLARAGTARGPIALERNVPSSWRDPSRQADWIAIAHPSLASGAASLADYRQSRGLSTAVVLVDDLYDEFTGGIPDPAAIRAFLGLALRSWQAPAPRFALLVGDGSFDPHGYRWPGSDLVPAPLIQADHLWTASDNWYAAVLGDDELPDIALGRIPARTSEELAAAIGKILAREEGGPPPGRERATLVSDNDDAAYDFSRAIREAAGLLRAGYDVEELHLAELGVGNTRAGIRDAFWEGRSLIGYMGHGSAAQWANESLLSASALAGFPPARPVGLVFAMGCMNGMYHLPQLRSLGEAIVLSPGRGAASFWGSTSLALPSGQEETMDELARILAAGGNSTLGEALTLAQLHTATIDADVLRTWVLLGDPAARSR